MHIDRNTRVMNIVADPELRAVLEWYGLPVSDRAMLRQSLESFCGAYDVDVEDLLVELTLGSEDEDYDEGFDRDDEWLSAESW